MQLGSHHDWLLFYQLTTGMTLVKLDYNREEKTMSNNETTASAEDEFMKKAMIWLMGGLFSVFFGLLFLAGTVAG